MDHVPGGERQVVEGQRRSPAEAGAKRDSKRQQIRCASDPLNGTSAVGQPLTYESFSHTRSSRNRMTSTPRTWPGSEPAQA